MLARRELLAHLRNKLRTNKLGGALAEVGVTELVEGAMFLWVGGSTHLQPGFWQAEYCCDSTPAWGQVFPNRRQAFRHPKFQVTVLGVVTGW